MRSWRRETMNPLPAWELPTYQGSSDNVVIIEDDSSRPAVANVIPPSNDSSVETEVSHSLESQQTNRR